MTDLLFPEMRRPLPSFKQWLEKEGVSELADGADAMVAFFDLTARTLEQRVDGLAAHEQSFLRLWQGTLVAAVELCNIERAKGVEPHMIVQLLPRVFAAASMYAVASICDTGSDWRVIGKRLAEEFRAGIKASADELERSYSEVGK